MHGSGEGVIGGLGHVDVVIRMDGLFRAQHSTGHINRPIGDHLVDVHVRLGAAAGLPNAEREVVVQFALGDLGGGFDDEIGFFLCEEAELLIGQSAGSFQVSKGVDERGRHRVVGDIEVVQGSLGLSSVITVRRNIHRPHRVAFLAGGSWFGSCRRHQESFMDENQSL